jgi:CDP-diacylglycerol--glycerol-3-phosphate 3-phosphatidyltransferase
MKSSLPQPQTRLYPHDRLLAATVLRLLPSWVTPNMITIARIILVPFVVWMVWNSWYLAGGLAFLFVAATDALDGSLARTRGPITNWGMVWDPVADKLLVGSVGVILVLRNFPEELAVVVFGLEAMFLVGGYYRKRQGRIVAANIWGKLKMNCQVVGIVLFIAYLAFGQPWLALASFVMVGLAVILALVALWTQSI